MVKQMKKFNAPFGVVVCTSPGDFLFAKGTCASIRYFMPDVPIALIVDGVIDTTALEQTYLVQVIRKPDIDNPWLRKHSFGWGITKMLAFWYSPFERFLYLDSDTIVWGDLREKLQWREFDFIADVPFHKQQELSESYVRTWFFEPKIIQQKFPDFPWQKYIYHYMCTGTFVTTKYLFSIQEYRQMLEFMEKCPSAFEFGSEMGLLNLMLFRAYDQEKLKLDFVDFQVIFPDFPIEILKSRFQFRDGIPVVETGDVQVLHMPDKKPLVNNSDCYSLPMTHFRLKFLEHAEGIVGDLAMQRLVEEDKDYYRLRKQAMRRKRYKKLFKLAIGHRGEWSRIVKRFSQHQTA